jgi:hypothetical protein
MLSIFRSLGLGRQDVIVMGRPWTIRTSAYGISLEHKAKESYH